MPDKFMTNRDCPWFPCHPDIPEESFNCLFCYCPLYPYKQCGGRFTLLENGWKDCSRCPFPHVKENAPALVERLIQVHDTAHKGSTP